MLIITGDADKIIWTEHVAPLAAELPQAQWIRLPGIEHRAVPPDWQLNAIVAWVTDRALPPFVETVPAATS